MADTWQIVSQVQDTQISDTGPGFDRIWDVKYRVTSGPATGTVGHVHLPVEGYSAQAVKQAVDAAVYHIDQVGGL